MDWQHLDWQTQMSIVIMGMGALILGVSIMKTAALFRATPLIAERSQRFVVRFLKINRGLMLFFFAGYLIVMMSLLAAKPIIGVLFVSVVFLFGAVFVLLELALHTRMLNEVQQTIQGLVPICMECKRVRGPGGLSHDQTAWKEIETYISQRTDAKFSHGICPECLDKIRQKR